MLSVKIVLVILLLLSIVVYYFQWQIFILTWERHYAFYKNFNLLRNYQPNIIFQMRLVATLVLHEVVYKIVMYFYFARLKPNNLPLTFFTFVTLASGTS